MIIEVAQTNSFAYCRYHNNRMINHELDRGQQVQTQFANYSTFHLPKVTRKDSGNYTCAPHNLRPASVFIHIIDEDSNSAAAAIHTAGDDNAENGAMAASRGTRPSFLETKGRANYVSYYFIMLNIIVRGYLYLRI